jgi:hypothetical protein
MRPRAPGKYGNVQKAASDGKVFASKRECRRYEELLLLAKMGKITDLQCQVPFEVIPKQKGERVCRYIADFVFRDEDDKLHVEDAKGFKTEGYRVRRKLMLFFHGIKIEEV